MNYKIPLTIAMIVGGIVATPFLYPRKELPKEITKAPQKAFCVYMIHSGAGDENDFSSYTQTQIQPPTCGGNDILCFFEICGDLDGTITEPEFDAAFALKDTNADGFLSDETEQDGVLEKFTASKAK